MNVLHVIASVGSGGAEGVMRRLVVSDRSNHHVIAVLIDDEDGINELLDAGIAVESFGFRRGRVRLKNFLGLYRFIRCHNPDVVQTWMYHSDLVGGLAAKLAGVKHICWGIRGPFNPERTSFATKCTVMVCAMFSYWIPATIVVNSQHAIKAHRRLGYDSRKFRYVPNGFDIIDVAKRFGPLNAFRREIKIDSDVHLIGMVARYDAHKDHDNLFKALSIVSRTLPNFTCVLVGDGMVNENRSLINSIKAAEVTDHVRLLGRRFDIPMILSNLDFHILSSVAESFPNVIGESMACGTPCISTRVGDVAYLMGDLGLIVEPSNHNALASAILRFFNDKKDSTKWQMSRQKNKERISQYFTTGKMTTAFNLIWRNDTI